MKTNCHSERSEESVWLGGTKNVNRATRPHRSLATLGMTCAAIAIALAAACNTTPPPPTPKAVSASALQDVGGESTDTAIGVPADAPNEGVDFENDWMLNRYGRFRRRGGGTGTLNGRRYDVVDIELANGDTKKVYFDITENWAKWNPPGH